MSADEKELGVPLGRVPRSDEHSKMAAQAATLAEHRRAHAASAMQAPWRVAAGDKRYVCAPGIAKPINVGNESRAAFIVLSANAHHGLVEALEKTLAALQESIEHIGLVRMQRGFSIEPIRERAGDAIESACTALSLLSTKGI